ncbi:MULTISPECIES: STAS domain-containing protein [unclassified Streptomyces]|uniref:STAS domain-containing protein n=1 Tax=unclassified Streptomyces TaxID=2593676 RepID=UPI000DBACE77|nr:MULTISPECIES: STAS domain-containing protein [unclassified Streptomyces]MYT69301.1 anti-sigma factor antagonist [Streptomyces sp. SID8367]RAJ79687.1 anti-sigma B factor antagonist [Streptomyces sp. PsTaAH-137]
MTHAAPESIPGDSSHVLRFATAPGPDGPVVALTGDLDYESAPRLLDALTGFVVPDGETLTLDLSDVRFFDSGGINALLRARRALQERNSDLAVSKLSPVVERIFRITGLDTVLVPDGPAGSGTGTDPSAG